MITGWHRHSGASPGDGEFTRPGSGDRPAVRPHRRRRRPRPRYL